MVLFLFLHLQLITEMDTVSSILEWSACDLTHHPVLGSSLIINEEISNVIE